MKTRGMHDPSSPRRTVGVVVWKFSKIALAFLAVSACAYYSLKGRIENENGPGSWEKWIGAAPDVEPASSTAPDRSRPKNLKARFWTGVPRVMDDSLVRLDRHGYSVGYSKSRKRGVWASAYIPGKSPSHSTPPASAGLWLDDPETTMGRDRTRPLPKGWRWAPMMPPKLMEAAYGWGRDSWNKSNRFASPERFAEAIWPAATDLAKKYATVYGGVVAVAGPYYADDSELPAGAFLLLLRSGPSGPDSLSFAFPFDNLSPPPEEMAKYLKSAGEIEAMSGVFLFADLPPEWRQYLCSPKQNRMWAK